MLACSPRLFATAVALVGVCGLAAAQGELTLYHFSALPQNLLTNPAAPQRARLSIGVSAAVAYHNSAFELSLLDLEGGPLLNSLARAAAEISTRQSVEADARVGIVDAAWRTERGTFSLGLAQRAFGRARIGDQALPYVYFGSDAVRPRVGEDLLADLEAEAAAFVELGLGYQTDADALTYGARVKVLRGQANAHVGSTRALVRELGERGDATRVEVLGSTSTAGLADVIDDAARPADVLTRGAGVGLGLDLGARLRIDERWSASASVLDLGFVSWGGRVRNYRLAADVVDWPGIEDADGPVEDYQGILDALRELDRDASATDAAIDGDRYARALPTRLLAGVEYALGKSSVGAVYRVRLGGGGLRHGAAASVNWRAWRVLELSGSYGVDGGNAHLVGAAAALTLGPVQVFATSDHVLGALEYERLGTSSVLAGVNVVLGERGGRGEEVDCPPMGGRRVGRRGRRR